MKKNIVFLFFLLATSMTSFAQSSSGVATGPKATWKKLSHDFGEITQGTPVTTEFKFTNEGSAPVVISDVKVSCGCTTPYWTKEPILPGKTGVIKAQYNAANAGNFKKSITVSLNTSEKTKVLYITGTVKAKEGR